MLSHLKEKKLNKARVVNSGYIIISIGDIFVESF